MLVKGQKIKIKWSTSNKDWYISKGYNFTKIRDEFWVNAEDLSPGSGAIVKVICDYCGKEHKKPYYSYITSRNKFPKDACNKCNGYKAQEVNKDKRIEEYYIKINNICDQNGYTLITNKEDIDGVRSKIEYICSKHGIQKSTVDYFIHGAYCYYCGRESVGNKLRYSSNEVESEINSFNNNKLLNKDEYTEVNVSNLIILCGKCKINKYQTSLSSYRKGIKQCPDCSNKTSTGELVIKKILEKYNINYENEKRFDDCRDVRTLPFDFYLSDYNICIEYDGKQHYYPVDYFGGEEELEVRQRHDKIKTQYCQDKNINLLRIPYWEKDNIEKIILDALEKYKLISKCV